MADTRDRANTHVSDLIGKFRVETSNPDNPKQGDMYFNTSNNYLMYYTGNNWIGVHFEE